MMTYLAFIAGFFYKFVVVSALLNACDYLKDIAQSAHSLGAIASHMSEARRKADAVERYFAAAKAEKLLELNEKIMAMV